MVSKSLKFEEDDPLHPSRCGRNYNSSLGTQQFQTQVTNLGSKSNQLYLYNIFPILYSALAYEKIQKILKLVFPLYELKILQRNICFMFPTI